MAEHIVGRTVLIKGLEFDHAGVLDADSLNARNLCPNTRATSADHSQQSGSNECVRQGSTGHEPEGIRTATAVLTYG
jgi:hypothetical protein